MAIKDTEKKRNSYSGYEKIQFAARVLFDVLATVFAWFISYFIKFYIIEDESELPLYQFTVLAAVAVVSVFCIMYIYGLYRSDVSLSRRTELLLIVKASFEEFLFVVFFYYYIIGEKVSREHLLIYFVLLFFFLVSGRSFASAIMRRRMKDGLFGQNVLLVGGGDGINEYCDSLDSNITGFAGQYLGDFCPVKGVRQIKAENLDEAIKQTGADFVVINFPQEMQSLENEVVSQALDVFTQNVYIIPHIPKSYAGTVIQSFRNIPMLKLNGAGPGIAGRFAKRLFDITACSAGVLILSPVYLVIAILVKLSSPGPVFFKQKRVTKDGRVFEMYKFRSMRTDMPEGKAHWTEENDPRITAIGRILRKTSLDEIPQFFNVIGGSMSLIGPRPERPELEEDFKKTIPGYNMRHRMKAGISGWAQVNGLRGNTSLEKRIDFDLYYVRNWTFLFDIKIFFLTFFKGFINKNAY